MATTTIVAWLVLFMLSAQPPGRSPHSRVVVPACGPSPSSPSCPRARVCEEEGTLCSPPSWSTAHRAWTRQENALEATARYQKLAEDSIRIVYDPEAKPIFSGAHARGQELIVFWANARGESGLRKDIEESVGAFSRGDGGGSWCVGQINVGAGMTPEGWSGPQLAEDHDKCFRASLRLMRSSYRQCRNLDPVDRLSGYIFGYCRPGFVYAQARILTARRWLEKHPVPVIDRLVLDELTAPPNASVDTPIVFAAD